MSSEEIPTILLPELIEDVKELMPIILPPEEGLEHGSKLRIKVCYGEKCVEGLGIANSGFAGKEPEIALPQEFVRELMGGEPSVILVERVLADGSRVLLPKLSNPINIYLVTEDKVEGPVKSYAYITRGRFILLNDALLSKLRVVIIDPFEGVWCFRDELGKRERRGA